MLVTAKARLSHWYIAKLGTHPSPIKIGQVSVVKNIRKHP